MISADNYKGKTTYQFLSLYKKDIERELLRLEIEKMLIMDCLCYVESEICFMDKTPTGEAG